MPFACVAAVEGPAVLVDGVCPGARAVEVVPSASNTPCGRDTSLEGRAPGYCEVDPVGVLIEGLDGFGAPPGGDKVPRGGADKFVERLIISLPCTTRLSLDFLRSRVSISVKHQARLAACSGRAATMVRS